MGKNPGKGGIVLSEGIEIILCFLRLVSSINLALNSHLFITKHPCRYEIISREKVKGSFSLSYSNQDFFAMYQRIRLSFSCLSLFDLIQIHCYCFRSKVREHRIIF